MNGAILGGTTFAAFGLLLLLSSIRTFTSTLYQALFGQVPYETAGAMALGVFAASVFALVVAWRSGPRASVALSGTLLAGGTLLAAAWRVDRADIVLAGVAVVGGTWWVALLHAARGGAGGSPLVLGLPLALVADLALRAVLRAQSVVDLAMPVALALTIVGTLVFLAAGLAWAGGEREWTSPGLRGAVALVAIPVLLLVTETAGTNPGQVAGSGGLDRGPQASGTWYLAAAAIGLGMAGGAAVLARTRPPARLAAIVLIAAGALLLWSHVPVVSTLAGALLAAGCFSAASLLADTAARPARAPVATVVSLTVGWILFVALAFVFYAYYAPPAVPLAAAGIVGLGVLAAMPLPTPRFGRAGVALVAALGIIAPLIAFATPPGLGTQAGERGSFRLMTYNIHQGFDEGNIPSLDRIADVIAAEDPDVVVLQEVVRGWMIDDQHDALTVLAERLGMRYLFDPQIGAVFGNAVLTRLPLADVRRIHYDRQPQLKHQPRGAVLFTVRGVLVVATHLDHINDATVVRQGQVRSILEAWNGQTPAIVAGDLNARPGAAELRMLEDAGFRDLAKDDGAEQPTIPSGRPTDRIDYVWGIGVGGSAAHTVATTASDHRPVVINISVR